MTHLKAVSTALVASLIGGAALAADLPSRRVAPAPVVAAAPIFTWTGLYVGLNAGYGWNRGDYSTYMAQGTHLGALANTALVGAIGTGSANRGGFTGGGQIGFNYQMGMFVAGLEADLAAMTGSNSLSGVGILTTGDAAFMNQRFGSGLFGTVRGRLGIGLDRFLIYATGGLAYRSGGYSWSYYDTLLNAVGGGSAGARTGWTLGGGVEWALSPNWSVKAEYLHADFGRVNSAGYVVSTSGGNNLVWTSARSKIDVVRLGVNYRFGWGAPVVARY